MLITPSGELCFQCSSPRFRHPSELPQPVKPHCWHLTCQVYNSKLSQKIVQRHKGSMVGVVMATALFPQSQLSPSLICFYDKYSNNRNFKEKWFPLAHGSRLQFVTVGKLRQEPEAALSHIIGGDAGRNLKQLVISHSRAERTEYVMLSCLSAAQSIYSSSSGLPFLGNDVTTTGWIFPL